MNVPSDVTTHRGKPTIGYNCNALMAKLLGGRIVEMTAFEPDAATHRSEWYYNTTTNMLYKKVIASNQPKKGVIKAYWKPALTV